MAENTKESPRQTLQFQAQVKSFEQKLKSLGFYKTLRPFETADTPPPKITRPVNPFTCKDPEVFKKNFVSPDIFDNVISPSEVQKKAGDLTWTLEEIARVNPANIESPQGLLDEPIDEEAATRYQKAIDKYFNETHNVITPEDWDGARDWCRNGDTPEGSPSTFPQQSSSTPHISRTRLDSSCQMDVSMQSSFASYDDDDNLSSFNKRNTLRRKLFHHAESPLLSDDEVNIDGADRRMKRSEWSPAREQPELQSPLISPIIPFKRGVPPAANMSIEHSSIITDRRMSIDVLSSDTGYGTSYTSHESTSTFSVSAMTHAQSTPSKI